jgi:hypothetical protein
MTNEAQMSARLGWRRRNRPDKRGNQTIVVEQHLCPACATANPAFASTCVSCSAALAAPAPAASPGTLPAFAPVPLPLPTAPAAGSLDYLRPEPLASNNGNGTAAATAGWPSPTLPVQSAAASVTPNEPAPAPAGGGLGAWAAATPRPVIDRDILGDEDQPEMGMAPAPRPAAPAPRPVAQGPATAPVNPFTAPSPAPVNPFTTPASSPAPVNPFAGGWGPAETAPATPAPQRPAAAASLNAAPPAPAPQPAPSFPSAPAAAAPQQPVAPSVPMFAPSPITASAPAPSAPIGPQINPFNGQPVTNQPIAPVPNPNFGVLSNSSPAVAPAPAPMPSPSLPAALGGVAEPASYPRPGASPAPAGATGFGATEPAAFQIGWGDAAAAPQNPAPMGGGWSPVSSGAPSLLDADLDPVAPAYRAPAPQSGGGSGGSGWSVREQKSAITQHEWQSPESPHAMAYGGYVDGNAAPAFPSVANQVGAFSGYNPYWAQPEKKSSPAARVVGVIMALAVMGLAGFGVYTVARSASGWKHTISAPASLAGSTQVALPPGSAGDIAGLKAEPHVTDAFMALYGTAAKPYALVMITEDQKLDQSFVTTGIAQFNGSGKGTFSEDTATRTVANGVTFECGPMTDGTSTLMTCVWIDGNVFGMIFGATGPADVLAKAEAAQATAEH